MFGNLKRMFAWLRSLHGLFRLAVAMITMLIMLLLVGCTGMPPQPDTVDLQPQLFVAPTAGQAGALISVTGSDWEPDEAVYLNLESSLNGQELSTTVAVARANESGQIAISFIFPSDASWTTQSEITLAARAVTSKLEAKTAMTVIAPVGIALPTSTPTSIPVIPATAPRRGQVTGDFVNVRQGPSTAYAVLFVAKERDGFNVLGQDTTGQWLRIRLDSGVDGWMARAFTNFTDTMPAVREVFLPAVNVPAPAIVNWRGEYYNNRDLSGSPVLVRNDVNVKFDWGFASPSARVPADGFSARWTRSIVFPAGTYRFTVTADDGVRIWIDGEQIFNRWIDSSAQTFSVERTFATTTSHDIRVEYYENTERAVIDFWWERLSEFAQWRGAYFANSNLTGTPALTRNDVAIAFDWGQVSPAAQIPNDNFSVRWTRNVEFDQGTYRFYAAMDDGLRFYVDGNLIIDQWRDGGVREIAVDYPLNRGSHALRVEYYERSGAAVARVWWEKTEPRVVYPDWKGEYWANTSLSGGPAIVRNDPIINFNWGTDAPVSLGTVDNFSARWTRVAQFESGLYRFRVEADDGVRLWIDDQLIIDDWRDGGSGEVSADRQLTAGPHAIRVEYYERSGLASITAWWERIPEQTNFPDWRGEYWSNRDLVGSPSFARNDRAVDFNWGTNPVANGMPRDNFSARWTRKLRFDQGNYRFFVRADDGVRAFIDGNLIINEWHANDASQIYSAERTLNGEHDFKVEYYESQGGARIEFWWQRIESTATPQPSPTNTSEPTATPQATATQPPTAEATPTETAVPTNTPEPAATNTPEPAPTNTPEPVPTNTPEPAPTNTPEPTSTNTPEPAPTNTPEPAPTNTPEPEPTVGLDPLASAAQNATTGMIDVTGSSFPLNTPADVYLQLPDGTRAAETIASSTTDGSGAYNTSFAMPATWPDGQPIASGPVTIVVVVQGDTLEASTSFEYVAP